MLYTANRERLRVTIKLPGFGKMIMVAENAQTFNEWIVMLRADDESFRLCLLERILHA